MVVKILGKGCKNCEKLAENVKKAADDLGLDVQIEKVTDLDKIVGYGVMKTPALVVDEELKHQGKVLAPSQIRKILSA